MKNRVNRTAAYSLILMGCGFLIFLFLQDQLWGSLLLGGFEAGLVGGLADWFAVTALFRHPLGIPIPHTALLPNNRDKMTEELVSIVEHQLLNQQSMIEKLKEIRVVEQMFDILQKQLPTERSKGVVIGFLETLLSVPAVWIWERAQPVLRNIVHSKDFSSSLLSFLDKEAAQGGAVHKGFDTLLNIAERWAANPHTRMQMGSMAIQAIQRLPMKGFLQIAVQTLLGYWNEERIGGVIQQSLLDKIRELRLDNPEREAFLGMLLNELKGAISDPNTNETVRSWLDNWLEGEQGPTMVDNLLKGLLAKVRDEHFYEELLLPLLETYLSSLRHNEEWMNRLQMMFQDAVIRILEANHSKIGTIVRENIEKMDNDTLIELVEDKAGSDLQWIRVNGAVCGFLIGLVLTSLQHLI